MTEAEWLECSDPLTLWDYLGRAVTPRKARLFAVACCEHIWPLLTDTRSRNAVAALRRSADEGRQGEPGIGAALAAAGNAIGAVWDTERMVQCRMVRDIFGNPFRPVTVKPAWLTADAVAMARSIYDDRGFDRLPILADALEKAGCTAAEVLQHCRQPGEHVRGCWVVELAMGKE